MTEREELIHEISILPDFIIPRLLNIVHYIRIGVENEYLPETENEFYNSPEFRQTVLESVADYEAGNTKEMDVIQQ